MDECNPPSLRFCPFLNIPNSSKRKNPECFYTRTIKAGYSNNADLEEVINELDRLTDTVNVDVSNINNVTNQLTEVLIKVII